ncbi:MAG TPA: hypothetical protein VJA00_01655, partial [Candidatus Omnitrophota bacterium]|nr:hypothetical protein [Candidatus Omnitrophota bacterium]
IRPGLYSYQFKVEDKEGHQDWTPLSFFRVISKADNSEQANRLIEIPPIGNFNLMKDGRRSIPLIAKPTIRIAGKTKLKNKIEINSRPVPVDPENGMFQTEFYTTAGEKDFVVTATTPEGESTRFHQTVKVKDSTFFMVALSEEQMGFNFDRGNIETSGQETTYKDGFYQDGRLSYALRGKLKGKFLIKSHYDTSDKRNALFTNLNPDDYYPIYGDASTRNYEMRDTRERFYMVVEWDRSHIKYGSFKTAFSDTELATYNRTLSGLKMNYESQASTPYGDSKRGVKAFAAESTTHLGDHNEFAATGGSLYYLRNRNVIQGSEKLRVEVRDKIQNMTLNSRDLVEGQDYEINDADGRIMLSRPLSSVAASDTLTSNDIMDGNPVVLIADYEYDAGADAFGVADRGFRGFLQMGDHIRVGATAVEEKRQNTDYDLRGLDMTMKFGRNTKITAEYAETINKQTDQAISYNGGLSFADLDLIKGENTAPRENAYLIKGETKPVKNMELSGYLQGIDPTFSTERSPSQEGTRKYGMSARYKFTDTFAFRYRYDMNDIAKQLMPLSGNNLTASYESYNTHTAQLVYDDGKWLGEAEYRNLNTNIPDFNQRLSSPLSEFSFQHGITGKLGYHLNDRMLPYVKVQTAINGKSNNQFGGGVRYQVTKNLFAFIEEMVGAAGDSTYFGFEQSHDRTRSYANLQMSNRGIGLPTLATTIGNSFALTENSRIFSERQRSMYQGVDGFADILGYDGRMGDHWDFQGKIERRRLDADRSRPIDSFTQLSLAPNNTSNVVSGAVGYANGKKLRARIALELRRDQDMPHLVQWVSRDSLEYKFNPDLSYLGKVDIGKSRFLDPDNTSANFLNLSTGFAYRPVAHDRLNALTRYSYLKNIANDAQFNGGLFSGVTADETAHVVAIDIAYDLYRWMGLVDKFAYKSSILNSNLADEIILHNFLFVQRLNFHVTRKWDIAAEYRALWQLDGARTLKHGPLFEVDRELYDYVRLGLGYNFTDFSDDLRKPSNFRSHGPFMRLTGKF